MFYRQLHGMRGLASLMVFFAHITAGYSLHINNFLGMYNDPNSIQFIITNIGTYGVEVFFFLSGFVIYKASKAEPEKVFFKRRFFRIYPVFILFTIIFLVLNVLTNSKPELNNIQVIFLNITFLNLFFNSPALTPNSWSLTYEVIYYFCTFYIVSSYTPIRMMTIKKTLAIIIFIWMVACFPVTLYFILGGVVSRYIFYIEIYLAKLGTFTINSIFLILLLCLIIIISQGETMEWSTALGSLRSTIISPLLLTACICLTFSRRLYVTKFLESKIMLFFGTISYTLYLLHPYVYKIIQIITIKIIYYDINIYALFWSFMVACTLVTIAISKVIYKYFECPIYSTFCSKSLFK
ncbi:acyltransferase family protein [Escherichia coli]|uniref:acyltransferase family protein n=3 Tax=Escherichia coli TaxID=562 RepID=UPI0002A31E3B|nr:acyltransferase [Escherichia coli]ELJ13658.1 hypothetical protein WKG_02341 [Escherichia coli KTE163]EOV39228.1 hypothetical protein A17G_02468 [Escherichia coli KTE221]EFB2942639.1 acyltransferase [Escherichia coli]EFH7446897.1 acyltransferase family protein [Escherichia coli]EJA7499632.1 acyltransferase [Escherichia coli]